MSLAGDVQHLYPVPPQPPAPAATGAAAEVLVPATPRRVGALMLGIVAALAIAGAVARAAILITDHHGTVELARRFDLDIENNIPAWFSSIALLAASGLLALIAIGKRRAGCRFRWHWTVLAAIFLVLSIDEAVFLHEMLRGPLHKRWDLNGLFFFAWVIPGFFAVLILAAAYGRFLLHLDARTRALFVVAGAIYVGAALGLEAVGGALVQVHGYESLLYSAVMMGEEILEMLGITLFVYALLDYLRQGSGSARIAFARPADS